MESLSFHTFLSSELYLHFISPEKGFFSFTKLLFQHCSSDWVFFMLGFLLVFHIYSLSKKSCTQKESTGRKETWWVVMPDCGVTQNGSVLSSVASPTVVPCKRKVHLSIFFCRDNQQHLVSITGTLANPF